MKKRVSCILLLLVMLAVSSYTAVAACTVDSDNDGYGIGCEKEDCNDNDYYVNPGVAEKCDNGIDDNCDGKVDEAPCTYCADYDKDTYGEGCAAGKDCDDTNSDINPGKTEKSFDMCIDGVDNNCDGLIDKDDPGCADFYPAPSAGAEEVVSSSGCMLSGTAWTNADGEIITAAAPEEQISLIAFGEGCEGEEATFSIYKKETADLMDEGSGTFELTEEAEGAFYVTEAPTEQGIYYFEVTLDSASLKSASLEVKSAEEMACEIQWDCSSIDYGPCIGGKKQREICPGYEGTAQCCADETSCDCTAIYSEEDCETLTYATPESEKSCLEAGGMKRTEANDEEAVAEEAVKAEGEFPWMLATGIAAGTIALAGLIIFLVMRKPGVQVPASLINYVKAAREKKIPDQAIAQALAKSGWKPEQIKTALKKAK